MSPAAVILIKKKLGNKSYENKVIATVFVAVPVDIITDQKRKQHTPKELLWREEIKRAGKPIRSF
jgi:hypothetical protein